MALREAIEFCEKGSAESSLRILPSRAKKNTSNLKIYVLYYDLPVLKTCGPHLFCLRSIKTF
jgi:hypothetical protein